MGRREGEVKLDGSDRASGWVDEQHAVHVECEQVLKKLATSSCMRDVPSGSGLDFGEHMLTVFLHDEISDELEVNVLVTRSQATALSGLFGDDLPAFRLQKFLSCLLPT